MNLATIEAAIEAELTESQLRHRVALLLKQEVSRTTLWRWQQDLGLKSAFTPEYACALAVFGRQRRRRKSVEEARQTVHRFCKEYGL